MIQFENAVKRYRLLILDEMDEVGIKCWLAGGALRDYFMGVPVKTDYDMFFPSEIEYDKARKYFSDNNCEVKWESNNGCKIKYNGNTYDLVKKYFNNPVDTINAFDFTVSMFAVDTKKIYHGETTFIDLAKKQLMFNKITYPASTLSRAFRYYTKGFKMCKGEMKKLFEAINDFKQEEATPENQEENNNVDLSSGDLAAFFASID